MRILTIDLGGVPVPGLFRRMVRSGIASGRWARSDT